MSKNYEKVKDFMKRNYGLWEWLEMPWAAGLRQTSFRRLPGKNTKRKSKEKYKIIKFKNIIFLICDFNIFQY